MAELMAILLFIAICAALMAGYTVAFTLGGVSLLFAGIGVLTGTFDGGYLSALPNRLFGIMNNQTMLAGVIGGALGVGLEKLGSAYIGSAATPVLMAAATATNDDGIAGCRRGRTPIRRTTTATTTSAGRSVDASASANTCAGKRGWTQ